LYRQAKGPNLLAIRDSTGDVFGAFSEEPWQPTQGGYGGMGSFVFRQGEDSDVEVFHRVGACSTQWAQPQSMGVDTAIVISEDLQHGTSLPSKAFGTDTSLSSMGEQFVIRQLVVWSLRIR